MAGFFGVIALFLLSNLRLPGAGISKAQHQVPNGFVIEKVAGSPEVVFPMFAAFDDRGRLFVAESSGLDLYAELTALTRKCRVRLLEDQDGDGRFEKAKVFADRLVFPMGLAWQAGKLYVADPPDLVTYEDEDGDGLADKRKVILSSFGHRDNGSLHGLIFGPDGLLYMTMGSPDGYRFQLPDGTVLAGKTGALIRCRPDGTQPEVLCRGFENLIEVVFTPEGAIIGTDNWFQLPRAGVRDALVHLIEGGLYPMHPDPDPRSTISGNLLPPISLYPAVALSGMVLSRGTSFPSEMRSNLFTAQHNSRKIGRHILSQDGTTFRVEDFDFVTSDDPDFHPSDVLEDADGSLLIIDTGGWYVQHCPTGKIRSSHAPGGIYRVRFQAAASIQDPWGLRIDWPGLSASALARLLEDPRPAVRARAQQLLSNPRVAAVEALASVLRSQASLSAKQSALWALAASSDPVARSLLREHLTHAEPGLATLAAQAVATGKDRAIAAKLIDLLDAPAPPVRLAAAQALAHCGDETSLQGIWKALSSGDPDRFLEHTLIHAAHWLAGRSALEQALLHPHPRVQKAALLLLEQPPVKALPSAAVMERVSAGDPELRETALQILQRHPEWAEAAIGFLEARFKKANLSAEEATGLRALIVAFQSQPALQQLVGGILTHRAGPLAEGRFQLVLESLTETTLPQPPSAWLEGIAQALRHPEVEIRRQAARVAGLWQTPLLDDHMARLANDLEAPPSLRLEALRGIILRRPSLSTASFRLLLDQISTNASPIFRLAAVEVLGRSHLIVDQMLPLLAVIRSDPLVSPSALLPALLRFRGEEIVPVFDYLADSIHHGWNPSAEELQRILSLAPPAIHPASYEVISDYGKRRREDEAGRLETLEPLLKGGNPDLGRSVFFSNKVACSTCHRLDNQGGVIGPDLTKIGAVRSGRDLIESIVLPSATFAQGYERYSAHLNGGREMEGIISRQTADALVLRDSSGAEWLLQRNDIKELKRQNLSLMPEGLDKALSSDEFRDLLAFLQSLK